VTDEILQRAFSAFGSLSDARIMADAATGKSRGYGFLAFRDRADAEQAIATMNGEWLGNRAIRVNWANSKTGGMDNSGGSQMSSMPIGGPPPGFGNPGPGMFGGPPQQPGPRLPNPNAGQVSVGGGMGIPEGGYGGGFGNATISTPVAPVSNGLDYGTVVTQSAATNCMCARSCQRSCLSHS
jgi:nucleolysin TIA-1/TIAR